MTPRAGIMRDLNSPWRRAEKPLAEARGSEQHFANTITYPLRLAACCGFVAQAFLPVWFWGVKTTQARMPVLQPQASKLNVAIWISMALISPTAFGQTLEAVRVIFRPLDRT